MVRPFRKPSSGRRFCTDPQHPKQHSPLPRIGKELATHDNTRGFLVLQFNAVVESNTHARHLYERLGFKQLGTIPGGFRMKDGHYENICPYYHEL